MVLFSLENMPKIRSVHYLYKEKTSIVVIKTNGFLCSITDHKTNAQTLNGNSVDEMKNERKKKL